VHTPTRRGSGKWGPSGGQRRERWLPSPTQCFPSCIVPTDVWPPAPLSCVLPRDWKSSGENQRKTGIIQPHIHKGWLNPRGGGVCVCGGGGRVVFHRYENEHNLHPGGRTCSRCEAAFSSQNAAWTEREMHTAGLYLFYFLNKSSPLKTFCGGGNRKTRRGRASLQTGHVARRATVTREGLIKATRWANQFMPPPKMHGMIWFDR